MTLSLKQRHALLSILEKIEEGQPPPRATGHVGRFLNEFALMRQRLRERIRHDGEFVRGATVGPIVLTPLAGLEETVKSDLLGEVASTIAVSDQLGGPVEVTLWGKARPANALRNAWLLGPSSVELAGAFRWFAPRRLTPGSATVSILDQPVDLFQARCLKFAGVEFLGPPTATAYRWDRSAGAPDLRTFRVVAIHRSSRSWDVIPVDPVREQSIQVLLDGENVESAVQGRELALALISRTPWDEAWTATRAVACDPDGILGHLISWADHRRELESLPPPDAGEVARLRAALASLGVSVDSERAVRRANLTRTIAPEVLPLAAWVRGIG